MESEINKTGRIKSFHANQCHKKRNNHKKTLIEQGVSGERTQR